MLSYLHSFHAGNIADLHKHLSLIAVLLYLRRKPAPFSYLDCHAGRGYYDLQSTEARATEEAAQGVLRVAKHWPEARNAHARAPGTALIEDYLSLLESWDEFKFPRYYPGSPAIAQQLMRDNDRATLLELHPQEYRLLKRHFAEDGRLAVHNRNSQEGLLALIPPKIRRGLILLDPSYEVKTEYANIARLLKSASHKWAQGIFIVWYPILAQERHKHLVERLGRLPQERKYRSELRWRTNAMAQASAPSSRGLMGSGLVILNAPWQFEVGFDASIGILASILSKGDEAQHKSELL